MPIQRRRFFSRLGSVLMLVAVVAWAEPVRPAAADIYYWTDARGVIHFSNRTAPADAHVYIVERQPAAGEQAETPNMAANPTAPPPSPSADQLVEANRKLEKALEQVKALSAQLDRSRREARAAAEEARQAATEARTADQTPSGSTIIYGVPVGRPPHQRYPAPAYWSHDTDRYPYFRDDPQGRRPIGERRLRSHDGRYRRMDRDAGRRATGSNQGRHEH